MEAVGSPLRPSAGSSGARVLLSLPLACHAQLLSLGGIPSTHTPTPVSFVCLLRTQSSDTHPAHLFGSRASAFYCHQPQSFQQTGLLFPRAARSFGPCLRLASPSSLCFPSASFLAPCYVPTLVFLSILVPSFNLCNLVIYVYSCKHLKSFPEMLGRNPKYHFYLHPESGGGQTTSR